MIMTTVNAGVKNVPWTPLVLPPPDKTCMVRATHNVCLFRLTLC